MRLLIIGALSGQIGAASQIAVARGAKVSHANDIDTAMRGLCNGQGADLIMIDTSLDIALLVSRLESERISIPVVACGVNDDAKVAVAAIKAGAQEYIPLPPDEELISAVLEAVVQEDIPLAMASFSFIGILALIAHFIADISYAFLDPRIRIKAEN